MYSGDDLFSKSAFVFNSIKKFFSKNKFKERIKKKNKKNTLRILFFFFAK